MCSLPKKSRIRPFWVRYELSIAYNFNYTNIYKYTCHNTRIHLLAIFFPFLFFFRIVLTGTLGNFEYEVLKVLGGAPLSTFSRENNDVLNSIDLFLPSCLFVIFVVFLSSVESNSWNEHQLAFNSRSVKFSLSESIKSASVGWISSVEKIRTSWWHMAFSSFMKKLAVNHL